MSVFSIYTRIIQYYHHHHHHHSVVCLTIVHSFFQSEFSAERNLMLPFFNFHVLYFSKDHSVAAYVFFLFFPSLLPSLYLAFKNVFIRQFLRKMWRILLIFFPPPLFIAYRIFLSPFALCTASSFLTRSVKRITIFLQHHILKLPRYFWSTFCSVQISSPFKAITQV